MINVIKLFSFPITGPAELCFGNAINESQLTYTVCGFPRPTVSWGFTENSTNTSLNGTARSDVYYAHDYSLYLTSNMCVMMLHFIAVGYNRKEISWSIKTKDCKPQFYTLDYYGRIFLLLICFAHLLLYSFIGSF